MGNKDVAILEKGLRELIGKEIYLDCMSNRVAYIKYMSMYPNDLKATELFGKINQTKGIQKADALEEGIKYFMEKRRTENG